mmetsp:Transcript_41140/g.129733  ORF Transcript_41140/g.129733 Transcript_41140/m.129733 type:complete len:451 (-) Transcript_41140:379-1731(-)
MDSVRTACGSLACGSRPRGEGSKLPRALFAHPRRAAGFNAFCSILAGRPRRARAGCTSLRMRCSVTTDKSAIHDPPASSTHISVQRASSRSNSSESSTRASSSGSARPPEKSQWTCAWSRDTSRTGSARSSSGSRRRRGAAGCATARREKRRRAAQLSRASGRPRCGQPCRHPSPPTAVSSPSSHPSASSSSGNALATAAPRAASPTDSAPHLGKADPHPSPPSAAPTTPLAAPDCVCVRLCCVESSAASLPAAEERRGGAAALTRMSNASSDRKTDSSSAIVASRTECGERSLSSALNVHPATSSPSSPSSPSHRRKAGGHGAAASGGLAQRRCERARTAGRMTEGSSNTPCLEGAVAIRPISEFASASSASTVLGPVLDVSPISTSPAASPGDAPPSPPPPTVSIAGNATARHSAEAPKSAQTVARAATSRARVRPPPASPPAMPPKG